MTETVSPESFVDSDVAGLVLDGDSLTIEDVVRIARAGELPVPVDIDPVAVSGMDASVRLKQKLIDKEIPIYGVTTGFGDSCIRQISPDKAPELQRNLVLYHLNGVGPIASADVVRATMLIRANCLVRGPSAIRPHTVRSLLGLLSADVVPAIPERGSLGASGDLVPLCYVAAALIGEGEVRHRGRTRPALDALADAGVAPVELAAKEGLALVNGTAFTSAFATLALWDAREIAFAADVATAMTCEALGGSASHFHPFLHRAKPHPGQRTSAALIRELLDGSALTTDYRQIVSEEEALDGRGFTELRARIQDKYSVRCAPHVTGMLRDTLEWADRWIEIEINSSTDNPLFDEENEEVHNGGNFYAGHVGQAMDSLKIAVANVADLLDRQLALVVDEKFNGGLPPNLVRPREAADHDAGLHHGFKGMQIAASAVTAEALKTTSAATAFSRSTEAHNQDKVSMGTIAARDARTVVELTRDVAAIHLLALAQAIELRGVRLASTASRRVHELIRAQAPFVDRDRRMDGDIRRVAELIRSGALRAVAAGQPSE
ncbi:histidine ammonia-lyase [Amycolatopsis roodepoortensis]|uniref:Histidine ammonia-lyase/phenylalanine ammonia-lyase n=1 Tax=Amycolatopsis roodepoortensis TaxID=700274 RepID=A0ABR9L126_9PSEU|nr:aromatic amino acid ammonia-lyase [Amycolatopsis roodepoortensis]MBE1574312.1 histidine ammonia-lyase/phenylalanine ammonia-lyase [Amycolatopsis roodepoortensis]